MQEPRLTRRKSHNFVSSQTGLDTTWIVESASTESVVASPFSTNGAFFSTKVFVMDHEVVIIPPGQYKAIQALEGKVFRVRPVRFDENGRPRAGSAIWLQYHAGVRSIGGHKTQNDTDCPVPWDPEPPRNHAAFDRARPKRLLKCHSIETGFRNQSPCPLHAYFRYNGTESYRFHLGVDRTDVALSMQEAWTSAVKFETSYITHRSVFRKAQTGAWVQGYVMQPTKVTGCYDDE